ncbi:MAG TPA: TlpA disulfide reductase family protein [Fimbriimonadaceae bacterium]|nr:TlpA disulfide reductase family protein [Fimbriimonadaceae bacterium]
MLQAIPPSLKVGDPAPAVVFRTAEGKTLRLASLKGKIVVITFTSYHCSSCRTLEPKLTEVAARDKDVVFLDVSIDPPEDLAKLAALRPKDDPIQLVQDPYFADRTKMGVWAFGDVATPTMFVIDGNGRMASQLNQDGVEGLSRLQFRIDWARKRKG